MDEEVFEPTIEKVSGDARGEIYVINLPGDKELILLHSKAGTLRGGHAHDVDEIVVMLEGELLYNKKVLHEGPEDRFPCWPGKVTFHRKGEFHLAEFLKDTWLLEYKLHTDKHSWRNYDDPEYRAKVLDAVNETS